MSTMGSVKITYNLYYPASMTLDEISREIKDHVSAIASTDSWLKENPPIVNIPVYSDWPGFQTDISHPGVETLRQVYKNVLGEDLTVNSQQVSHGYFIYCQSRNPCCWFRPRRKRNQSARSR